MPIRIAVINVSNGNTLASRDLTDAQVTRIQQVFPGTNAQIAQQVVDDCVRRLRAAAKNKGQNNARAAGEATIQTDSQAFETAFLGDWAEV